MVFPPLFLILIYIYASFCGRPGYVSDTKNNGNSREDGDKDDNDGDDIHALGCGI